MKNIFDFTVSGIDGNGQQYMTGMLEPERLDSHNLRIGKAFSINMNHKKQCTELYLFNWISGTPHDWKLIATFKDEIISESEVPTILKKYKLI